MQAGLRRSGGETVTRLLEELCLPGALDRVHEGERHLKDYVEAEARELSPELFSKLMGDLHRRVEYMMRSPDNHKKLGAILAIDELVLVKAVQDDAARTAGFSLLLRRLFEECDEPGLVEVAAQALGHLVAHSGQSMSDIVERQVREALPWLALAVTPQQRQQQQQQQQYLPPSEHRRYAAVLICREMASEAPAVFNVHVQPFLDGIWGGLRDPKLHIREASVQALERVLVLVEKRETRYRVQWYYGLFESTMSCLSREPWTGTLPSAEAIHGGLLSLGELLGHTGEFLLARYREVVETVLRFKDSKEKMIRRAVIRLLARLAAFAPERFAQDYLVKCILHLLAVLKHTGERGAAFAALADMASSLAAVGCQEGFEGYLGAIAAQLNETLQCRAKSKGQAGAVTEALACVGVLARALHLAWQPYAQQLLSVMMLTGPSQNLVHALADIAAALPDLLEDIQGQLLDLMALILSGKPFNSLTKGKALAGLAHSLSMSELSMSEQIRLALNTIGAMDFGRVNLLELMREHILIYLDDPDKDVRQAAALACCRVLDRHARAAAAAAAAQAAAAAVASAAAGPDGLGADRAASRGGGPNGYLSGPPAVSAGPPGSALLVGGTGAAAAAAAVGGSLGLGLRHTKMVEVAVGKLLMAAVADTSERVRRTVLQALTASPALDEYLSQADCLRALFIALNDESKECRATAVQLVGRLAAWNPAYVAPALRRHLLQLLTDLAYSPDSKQRDDSAFLINCLINDAPQLIMPYVSPILKALVSKLKGSSAAAGAAATPASTVSSAAAAAVVSHPQLASPGSSILTAGGSTLSSAAGGSSSLSKDAKAVVSSEAGVVRSVLATLGALAQQAGTGFKPFVAEVMPLVIEAIQDLPAPSKRRAAVITLGQICQSAGCVMTPYWDFPQLLSLLLRLLHEGNLAKGRCEVMRVLGIIGALDPYTHKINTASLSGEGKLELEGVRPMRNNQTAAANIAASIMAGTPLGTGGIGGAGATGGDEFGSDLLPAAGLVTSSEDYYPTVAINALMRVLRDSALASQHQVVVSSLMQIFKALGTASVPYLPKVLPVLFAVLRVCDEPLRELLLDQLVVLVMVVRQHIRRFLPDLLGLLGEFWGLSSRTQHTCLKMLAELAISLRDDLRPHMPELLPRLVALFVDAERTGNFEMVKPGLEALEALGVALEEQLHLLLPALMRLVSGSASTPLEVRRSVLRSLRRLLPRMHLAGFSSTVLQPLMKVLDGPSDELRFDALDTICALAMALGQDFTIFVPTICKIVVRYRLQHERFERLAGKFLSPEPPCCSDAEDWEDAGGWAAELDAVAESAGYTQHPMPLDPGAAAPVKLSGQISALRKAWESSARVTKDDWSEWMRHFSVELLAQSPSPALRACHSLAQVHPQMARELFAAGFVSCWSELDPASQEQLVRSLEAALASPTIPPEIVTALLNLAEFMEHDDKRLPLDTRTLGALAEKCHAFAKALHYKELEFVSSPPTAIEALIHINNQLRQPEAAVGVLTYAQKHLAMELKESWYEKLCRWDEALAAYEGKLHLTQPSSQEYLTALLGKMRCLASLAEWEKLSSLCRTEWRKSEPHMRKEMSLIAAHAAWHMGEWEEMAIYVDTVDSGPGGSNSPSHLAAAASMALQQQQQHPMLGSNAANALSAAATTMSTSSSTSSRSSGGFRLVGGAAAVPGPPAGGSGGAGGAASSTGAFLRAVLCIKHDQHDLAQVNIERSREMMSTDLAALVGESYERAYTDMVRVQQLTELEEVIAYKEAVTRRTVEPVKADEQMRFIRELWRRRLSGVQRNVEVWQSLFSVRNLVVPMHDDVDAWLKFAGLCRKSGRQRQARRMLVQLLRYDPSVTHPGQPGFGAGSGAPSVMLAYCKHLWNSGERREALSRLRELVDEVRLLPHPELQQFVKPDLSNLPPAEGAGSLSTLAAKRFRERAKPSLHARCYLRLGLYEWHHADAAEQHLAHCMDLLRAATEYGAVWPKAWHHWALFNCGLLEALVKQGDTTAARSYVAPAVTGFFRSVALGQAAGDRTGNLQDVLRLLTLWFTWGSAPDVESALNEGFGLVSIDTWLGVIPQIIARIHTNNPQVRTLIHNLLVRIGRHHPQALMYPLLVATKSQSPSRRQAAQAVLEMLRTHSATLVDQAQLVSGELIRIAILWHEQWHEALEEASRLYFGESNVEGMLQVLLPLHEKMEREGPSTLKEIAFVQTYGRELSEAYEWIQKFKVSRKEAELHQAWDLYYHVFKRINKQLHSLTTLELQYVAPALVRALGMELAVPGTYIAGEPLVTIAAFAPQLQVISSKQRPRKLTIHGGDGAEYMFLLKGHEDLRQDERVMQLFGLVNSMLGAERSTAERDLSIARYAVIPLSPNSGLIGWVPNCDTLHQLIREYRESRKIPLNWEHRLMLGMAPDYDHLPVINKVEVFEYALDSTSGEDLHKVLWLKSRNSEVWLDRRTTYTRSTAVMSMVGYLLGLGDRHPSNLMLDRYSGKLLHIDFGDCFEASMNRDKFPEKVPFRLTRMMIKAMEVSGIEGNFRTTCEAVLRVLRTHKDSLMAMLEAFVHDPLINWRLLNATEAATEAALARDTDGAAAAAAAGGAPGATAAPGGAAGGGGIMSGAQPGEMPSPPQRGARERELREARDQLRDQHAGDASEVLNERAMTVMKRMTDKLMGRDHVVDGSSSNSSSSNSDQACDSVPAQVQRLIAQAISHENLCQSYIGWCPFW